MAITNILFYFKALFFFFQKICKMLKASMWDYEKLSVLTFLFFISEIDSPYII